MHCFYSIVSFQNFGSPLLKGEGHIMKKASQSEGQKRLAAKRKASNDLTKAVAEDKRVIEDIKKIMMETNSKYNGEISAL